MLAAYITHFNETDPASAVTVGDRPDPVAPDDDWTVVEVRAASLNHHDVFAARGVGLTADHLPMIIGMDAAGIDETGREVILHTVIHSRGYVGDERLDPGATGLSEAVQGTFADRVAVPRRNLVPKPAELSFSEAACLPTAWLTAYTMLFDAANELRPGDTVLVQGAAGGVASAAIALGSAAGLRMWATGRSAAKRQFAESLGADRTFEPGARLPERVSAVMDGVGGPTWDHSLRCLRRGGTMVVTGATGGHVAETQVARLFVNRLKIVGTNMGTLNDLHRLIAFVASHRLKPAIDTEIPLTDAQQAIRALATGNVMGKIVIIP
jgi:NADPH:quinone reductase-like Zn-dependent oxidoreductase